MWKLTLMGSQFKVERIVGWEGCKREIHSTLSKDLERAPANLPETTSIVTMNFSEFDLTPLGVEYL